jgi:hypothetical protein
MQAAIQLTRLAAPSLGQEQHAWPMTVQAYGTNISSDIFVYRLGKLGDPFTSSQFSCVASVSQLSEIPAQQSVTLDASLQIPWYRTNQVELVFRSEAELIACWNVLQQEVALLVDNYNNSFAMQTTEVINIGGAAAITAQPIMRPPTRVQLNYEPAGVPTLNNGVQDVSAPDQSLPGWLPASMAPASWTVPLGAKFFYNMAQDATLTQNWPLPEPLSGNMLFRDGVQLPYGVTHVFTKDAIWWMSFDPATVPGYSPSGALNGNAPWPTDYLGQDTPGAVSPLIYIEIFE